MLWEEGILRALNFSGISSFTSSFTRYLEVESLKGLETVGGLEVVTELNEVSQEWAAVDGFFLVKFW